MSEEAKCKLDELSAKFDGHITLLDLAKIWNDAVFSGLKLPSFLLEEPGIIPHIKARYFSISNDPFAENQWTKDLEIIFSETQFEAGKERRLGFATQFLTSADTIQNQTEMKIQLSPQTRILHLPAV